MFKHLQLVLLYERKTRLDAVLTLSSFHALRAENETRTRDPNLGKVVLYQLSYFRLTLCEEEETRTPTPYWHYPLKVARLPIPPPLQLMLSFQKISLFNRATFYAIPLNCECKGKAFFDIYKTFGHFFANNALFFCPKPSFKRILGCLMYSQYSPYIEVKREEWLPYCLVWIVCKEINIPPKVVDKS